MNGLVLSDVSWTRAEFAEYQELRPFRRQAALQARSQAVHYNGYQVGAVCQADTPTRTVLIPGFNYKAQAGERGPNDCCAEESAEQAALYSPCCCLRIRSFTIAAFPKIDDYSGGHLEECLIPCGSCRQRLSQHCLDEDGFVRNDTAIELLRLGRKNNQIIIEHSVELTTARLLQLFPPPIELVSLSDAIYRSKRGPHRPSRGLN